MVGIRRRAHVRGEEGERERERTRDAARGAEEDSANVNDFPTCGAFD